jgi:hypothetical protein
MPEPLLYLQAMGAAAVVSALLVLTLCGLQRPVTAARPNVAYVLAMGLGLAAGNFVLSLRWPWPPMNGLDRFLTIVVPAVLGIEFVAEFQAVPRWGAWFLRMSLAATAPRILLHGSTYLTGTDHDWPGWQALTALSICGGLLAGMWALMSWLSQRSPGMSIPLALGLAIQCTGLTVMMAGYLKGGAAAFPLAAALVATSIAGGLVTKRSDRASIIGIGVVGLFGLLFIGRFFGRLSTVSAVVLLLAPLLCWVSELPFLRCRSPWLVGSLRFLLVAMALAVVLAMAKRDFDREMAPLLGKAQGPHCRVTELFSGRCLS